MARKNMFEGIAPAQRPEDAEIPALPRSAAKMPEVFQSAGPIAAIRNDLRSLSSRSVQEIDPEMIEDTGLKDRLSSLDDDVAELRDSIAKHGQQVPILLRPHPTLSGRYQVVYGRRRLAAIRALRTPVKALIRTLSDEEAVLAQGQENSLRKDPSFIEKALFAGDLEEAGYGCAGCAERQSKPYLSHAQGARGHPTRSYRTHRCGTVDWLETLVRTCLPHSR
jgi:ParB family transcriptional regulator, chromosome partitioning protein